MFTILDLTTNKVLFAKFDDEVIEGQIAIDKICDIENPDGKDIYFNFDEQIFYLQ